MIATTDRENEICKGVLAGKTNKQIGLMMGVSANTVKAHCRNVFMKHGLTNRDELYVKLRLEQLEGSAEAGPGARAICDRLSKLQHDINELKAFVLERGANHAG